MYKYYIMPKNTKKLKFNINLIPSRRIYKTRRLLGGMENEDFYKKNTDYFSKRSKNKQTRKANSLNEKMEVIDQELINLQKQFESFPLNDKRKTREGSQLKQRKSKTQRRRTKTLGGMESLPIDYEIPLKKNKSLIPSSIPSRPNLIQTQKTILKKQIQLEKARRKLEFKRYIDANKNLLAKTDLRVTDNDWVKGINMLIDVDDSVPELQTHLDLNYEDVKNIFLNKK